VSPALPLTRVQTDRQTCQCYQATLLQHYLRVASDRMILEYVNNVELIALRLWIGASNGSEVGGSTQDGRGKDSWTYNKRGLLQ